MVKNLEEWFRIELTYTINAIEGEFEQSESDKLLKIGELAKATNQTVPTIRHWTK